MAIGYAAWSASFLQPARACSLAPQAEHTLDPDEEAVDTTPPESPVLGDLRIARQPRLPGCEEDGLCDGTGLISFRITAPADDRTPGAEMGYLIEFTGGDVPGVFPPDGPVRVDAAEEIYVYFSDEDQRLDFTLSVRAMDLGGNVGEPVMIEVSHGGGGGCLDDGRPQPGDGEAGGCSATGPSSPVALGVILLALGLSVRRRRAR